MREFIRRTLSAAQGSINDHIARGAHIHPFPAGRSSFTRSGHLSIRHFLRAKVCIYGSVVSNSDSMQSISRQLDASASLYPLSELRCHRNLTRLCVTDFS